MNPNFPRVRPFRVPRFSVNEQDEKRNLKSEKLGRTIGSETGLTLTNPLGHRFTQERTSILPRRFSLVAIPQ